MKFTAITHPDDVEMGIERFGRARTGETDRDNISKRYIRKDGRVIYVIVMTKYVYAADGKMTYAVGFVQDITEQKNVEKELRERLPIRLVSIHLVRDPTFFPLPDCCLQCLMNDWALMG